MRLSKRFLEALKVIIVAFVILVCLFPIYWMIVTSLEPWEVVLTWPPPFIPLGFTTEYWDMAFSKLFLPLSNSLIISGLTMLISVIIGLPSAYSFARFKIGGTQITFWILSLKFLPGIVPAVAFYILFSSLGLLDTQFAVIITHLVITLPFAIWMLKAFIEKIPLEIEEAAMLDGCSRFSVIHKVIFPLSIPGIVVTALFCFLWSWNEFMLALILTKSKAYTLPVMIASFRGAGMIWGGISASALLAIIPALILAVFLQKYLVTGLTMGAVKGG